MGNEKFFPQNLLEYLLQETTFEYHRNIEEICFDQFDRIRASGDTKILNNSPPLHLTDNKMMQTDASESKETKEKKKKRTKKQKTVKRNETNQQPGRARKNGYLETVRTPVADTKEIVSNSDSIRV